MTQKTLDTNITDTPLSGRVINCCISEKILNVGHLSQMSASQLLRVPNMGKKGVAEISDYLDSLGYELKGKDKITKVNMKKLSVQELIDEAVNKEREKCADRAWMALIKNQLPWNVRQDVTNAIMAKDEA